MLLPTAAAVEHGGSRSSSRDADDLSNLAATIANADTLPNPHIVGLGVELTSGDGSARSDWAFDALLDGLVTATTRIHTKEE